MGRAWLVAAVAFTMLVATDAEANVCVVAGNAWLHQPHGPVPRNTQLWIIAGSGDVSVDGPTGQDYVPFEMGEEGQFRAHLDAEPFVPGRYSIARYVGESVELRVEDRIDVTPPPRPDPSRVRIELGPEAADGRPGTVQRIAVGALDPDTALVRVQIDATYDPIDRYVAPDSAIENPGGWLSPVPATVRLTAIDFAGNESPSRIGTVLPVIADATCELEPQLRTSFADSDLAITAGFLALGGLFLLVFVGAWRRLERGPNGEMPYEVTTAMGEHVLRKVRARELRAIAFILLVIACGRHYGLWTYLGDGAAIGLVYLAFRIGDLAIAQRALRLCTDAARATVFGGCLVIRNKRWRASVFLTRRARDGVMPPARTSL